MDEDTEPRRQGKGTLTRIVVFTMVAVAFAPAVILGLPIKGLDYGNAPSFGVLKTLIDSRRCDPAGHGAQAC